MLQVNCFTQSEYKRINTQIWDSFRRFCMQFLEIKIFLFHNFQVCVTFTWKDAFDKGSLFGGSAKLGM